MCSTSYTWKDHGTHSHQIKQKQQQQPKCTDVFNKLHLKRPWYTFWCGKIRQLRRQKRRREEQKDKVKRMVRGKTDTDRKKMSKKIILKLKHNSCWCFRMSVKSQTQPQYPQPSLITPCPPVLHTQLCTTVFADFIPNKFKWQNMLQSNELTYGKRKYNKGTPQLLVLPAKEHLNS